MTDDPAADVIVRDGTDADVDACLDVLNQSYDTSRFTPEWFAWKHRECPFGASRIIIAEGSDGFYGAFFALPWDYESEGRAIPGSRTVDGGTLPAARGRRVLGAMIAHEVNRWSSDSNPGIVVATATDAARKSHQRNATLALDELRYAYCQLPFARPGGVDFDPAALDDYVSAGQHAVGTHWTPAALRWRIDARSTNDYEVARLRSSDTSNGLVFRIVSQRGLRTLVPVVAWGSTQDLARLLVSVALRRGAITALAPVGPGAVPLPLVPRRPAGHAWVCAWDRRVPVQEHESSELADLAGWCMGYGELEGLI